MIIKIDGVHVEFEARETPQDGQMLIQRIEKAVEEKKILSALLDEAEQAAFVLTVVSSALDMKTSVFVAGLGVDQARLSSAIQRGALKALSEGH